MPRCTPAIGANPSGVFGFDTRRKAIFPVRCPYFDASVERRSPPSGPSPSLSLKVYAPHSGKEVAAPQERLTSLLCSRCTLELLRRAAAAGGVILKLGTRSSFLTAVICAILWIVLAVWLHAQDTPFHNAPPSSVSLKNPYAGQETAVTAGSRLYATNCSSCHGSHGQGNGAMPAVSQGPTQSASDGEVFWFITTGAVDKGMPSWSTLSERQRWQLVSYLKSLKNPHASQESGSASK